MAIKQETVNGGKRIVLRHSSGPDKGNLAGSVSIEGRNGVRDMEIPGQPPYPANIELNPDLTGVYSRFHREHPTARGDIDEAVNEPLEEPLAGPVIDEWGSVWLQKLPPEEQIAYMATRLLPAGLGEDQAHDVYEATRRSIKRIKPAPDDPTDEEFQAWIDQTRERFADPENNFTAEQRAEALRRLADVAAATKPGGQTFAMMSQAGSRTWRARYALDDQARQIAAWVDVQDWDVKAEITKYRTEYYALADAGQTPVVDPGYKKAWGRTGGSAPKDPATAYSHWRAETPELYLDPRPPQRFVALDLETTGLTTRDHHIIEVGFVEYDQNGTETGRWSQLVRPPLDADGVLSTGGPALFEVHHISPEDVADKPSFEEIIPEIQARLAGATIIGHNLGFDTKHLRVNLKKHAPVDDPSAGRPTWVGEADTLFHASRHMSSLENNKLNTVAAFFGITNERAHRATEDAAVSGEVFFKVREELKARQARAIQEAADRVA